MQGNETYRMVMRRGPQPNQVYEFTGDVSNLGRDITNDIVINDREVSRHHLRFMRGIDGYTIEDLGSTNGTFVNGKRLTGATSLKHGDMLGLGETVTLQFEAVRPGGATVPSPAPQAMPQETMKSSSSTDEERYRPPTPINAPKPTPAPQENPYRPPAPQPVAPVYQAPQQQVDYAAQPEYAQQYAPQGDYGNAAAYAPPPPGYDYDPYAMREEEGGGMTQWFLVGCLGLLLLCCCMTVALAVAVDTFCLYDYIPFLSDALSALGLTPSC